MHIYLIFNGFSLRVRRGGLRECTSCESWFSFFTTKAHKARLADACRTGLPELPNGRQGCHKGAQRFAIIY